MVVINPDKENKVVIVNCNCGCDEEIHIKKFSDDTSTEYYLTIHEPKFYSKQNGIFRTISNRIKSACRILRGKDYLLCDICLSEEEINQLVKNLKEIQK